MERVENLATAIVSACENHTGAEIMSGMLAAICEISEAVGIKPQMVLVHMMELLQMNTKNEQEN